MADYPAYKAGPKEVEFVPVGSGVSIEIGDLLRLTSGKATRMTAVGDNLTFIGVAAEAHGTSDPSGTIAVYPPNAQTVFEYNLDSATAITYGDALQFNTRQALKKSTTDPIATAVESKLAATSVKVKFRIPHLTGNQDRVGDAS